MWRDRLAAVDPVKAALILGGIALAFGVLGSLDVLGRPQMRFLNLNREGVPPAMYSMLLWFAAGLTCLAAGAASGRRPVRIAWSIIGVMLVFLGFDEALALHEDFETTIGFSYQVVYAPLMLAGAAAGAWLILGSERLRASSVLLVVGGLTFLSAQFIDEAQWEEGELALPYWTIVPEEMLEMTGLICTGLSALVALRAYVAASRAAQARARPAERRPAARAEDPPVAHTV